MKIEFLDTKDASKIIGIGVGTLRAWRSQGKGPRFYKCDGQKGAVRYDINDLLEWMKNNFQNIPKS